MSRQFVRVAVLAVLGAAMVSFGTPAKGKSQGKYEGLVKLSATAGPIGNDGKQTVTIKMQIHPDWHAYANPVQNEDLKTNKTDVNVQADKQLADLKINYPAGTRRESNKETFQAYEGTVEFTATVQRATGDAGPLRVGVTYYICSHTPNEVCLPGEFAVGECPPGKTVTLEVKKDKK